MMAQVCLNGARVPLYLYYYIIYCDCSCTILYSLFCYRLVEVGETMAGMTFDIMKNN